MLLQYLTGCRFSHYDRDVPVVEDRNQLPKCCRIETHVRSGHMHLRSRGFKGFLVKVGLQTQSRNSGSSGSKRISGPEGWQLTGSPLSGCTSRNKAFPTMPSFCAKSCGGPSQPCVFFVWCVYIYIYCRQMIGPGTFVTAEVLRAPAAGFATECGGQSCPRTSGV